MKCIVPGTYQTLPLPNTILIIIMTTLVLPTASLTHTFLSMWPYWGFNREWEKGIYLSLHTAANLKSQYTFSSPKPFPAMAHQVFFSLCSPKKAPDTWLLLSLQDYQLHPKMHTQFLPGTQQSKGPPPQQWIIWHSLPPIMLTMATEAKQVLCWLQGLPVGWSQIQLCKRPTAQNISSHQERGSNSISS